MIISIEKDMLLNVNISVNSYTAGINNVAHFNVDKTNKTLDQI